MNKIVYINKCSKYDVETVIAALPNDLFLQIKPGQSVIIKPNWVMESHKTRSDDWQYVITHPTVISAVIRKVVENLAGCGRISIVDGPMTEASIEKILCRYPVEEWRQLARQSGVGLEIIDLRDHEWVMKNHVIIERKKLPGDPRGKLLFDLLNEMSEFFGHRRSRRGYYGADYDRSETNRSHDGHHNLYSVSRTVIDGDVFINIPKLKTHRLAGITCCLKNLVGINTYKNYLPHYSEGSPAESGDQFPTDNFAAKVEGPVSALIKQYILRVPFLAKHLTHINTIGKKVFGDSNKVVRNGSWFGNDTIWRMILDLNKVLLYGNADGTMRSGGTVRAKNYIGVVDAILAGEGEGPLSPEPVSMGRLICGMNPVAIDAACSILMGFDPLKIPSIAKGFEVRNFPLSGFGIRDVEVYVDGIMYNLDSLPEGEIIPFKPHHGWRGRIEKEPVKY